jgi:hypothetical protein
MILVVMERSYSRKVNWRVCACMPVLSGIYLIHNYTPIEQHLLANGVVRHVQNAGCAISDSMKMSRNVAYSNHV